MTENKKLLNCMNCMVCLIHGWVMKMKQKMDILLFYC